MRRYASRSTVLTQPGADRSIYLPLSSTAVDVSSDAAITSAAPIAHYLAVDLINAVWETFDAGRTWTQVSTESANDKIQVWVRLTSGRIVGITGFGRNSAWYSDDIGRNWAEVPLPEITANDFYGNGIAYDGSVIVATGYQDAGGGNNDSAVVWSDDDGLTWTRQPVPATLRTPAINSIARAIVHDGAYFVMSDDEAVWYRSADGSTWTQRSTQEIGVELLTAYLPSAGPEAIGNLMAGQFNDWYETQNQGASWALLGGPTGGRPSTINAHADTSGSFPIERPDGLILAFGSINLQNRGHVALTTGNGGVTWSEGDFIKEYDGDDNSRISSWPLWDADRGLFVALGERWKSGVGFPVIWESADGLTWTPYPITPDDFSVTAPYQGLIGPL